MMLLVGGQEARKYHSSSRMVQIQAEIANRAIELLALPVRLACTTPISAARCADRVLGVRCAVRHARSKGRRTTSWTSAAGAA